MPNGRIDLRFVRKVLGEFTLFPRTLRIGTGDVPVLRGVLVGNANTSLRWACPREKYHMKSTSDKPKKKKKGFMDVYKTYDTSNGFGSRTEWRENFYDRIGFEKAVEVLGETDPLVLFGLTRDASWEDVVATYRKLARQNHPDLGGSKEAMQKINAAFEVLERRYGK
jgi:hypothetical protein